MKQLLKKYRIEITLTLLFAFCLLVCSSCNKKEDVFSTPTALKFIEKKIDTTGTSFKYEYTLLKYNNSWYERKLPDGSKKIFTDVQKLRVFSNMEKPMDKWIDYYQWMRDTTILTFRNPAIDSIPHGYKNIEATDSELRGL